MSDSANAFRAGLVIVVGAIIATAFFLVSRKTTLDDNNSVPYYAFLTDASGINAKSLITIAGLQVGEIKTIELVDVPLGELIPDLEPRALDLIDPLQPAKGPDGLPEPGSNGAAVVRPGGNALHPHRRTSEDLEFDGVLRGLAAQGKLMTAADIAPLKAEQRKVARVSVRISSAIQIPDDSVFKKESLGLLGAKALFLELGPSKTLVPKDGRIIHVLSMTGTDALIAQAAGIVSDVKSITAKLDDNIGGITADIRGITSELNRFINGDANTKPLSELYTLVMTDLRKLAGTVEKAVRDTNALVNDKTGEVAQLLANVRRISGDIADLTAKGEAVAGSTGPDGGPAVAGEGDLRATMTSVRKVTDDLAVVTGQLKTMLGDNESEMGEGVKSIKVTIDELNRSLASLSEVVGRVERGEGTVGRLLTDEKIADKVESAVSGAADYVSSLTAIEAYVDVGTRYNFNRGGTASYLGLRIQPKPDKFYLVEVVDDGGFIESVTERTVNGSVRRESVRTEDNQIRITAMFAKRFFDFLILRAGLIETTGGLGANIMFFDDRVELRSDLFDFRGPRDTLATDLLPGFYLPRWRTFLKVQPIPFLYLSAGVDDVLNSYGPTGFRAYTADLGYGFDYFVGAGLTFKDDDLRAILPFIPGG